MFNGTGSSASAFAPNFSDGSNITSIALDLHPTTVLAHPGTFGLSIGRLADCFVNWRIRSLKVSFVPIYGTSTSGVVSIGYRNDARDNDAPGSLQEVCSCGDNFITPVWCPSEFDLTRTLKTTAQNWYYTNVSTDTEDTDRQVSPGSIQAYVDMSPIANSITVGYLRFSGVLEFRSLARADLMGLKKQAPEHEEEKYLAPTTECSPGSEPSPYFMVSGPPLATSLSSQPAPPMNRHGSLPSAPPQLMRS